MTTPTADFVDARDFRRIAAAIAWIDQHFREQPKLRDMARAVHLSEFHFNRLFRRWAGVTPKQYLAHVTARAARGALADGPSVLDAAHALGLSGPSRLHDLTVTLEALTPGEIRSGGQGVVVTAGFCDTPFGCALIGTTARGITHLSFVEPGGEAAALAELRSAWPKSQHLRDDAAAARVACRIFGAQGGGAGPLRVAVAGTNFQLKLWRALLAIGRDRTVSYGELARAVGAPKAVRAVGSGVGANPVACLIPCHNVLRGDGTLGGYHWGTERKRAMHAFMDLRRGARQIPPALRSAAR